VGDIVAAEGVLTRTKTGELSVKADVLRLLTKSLRPLPDKWHGLSDVEQRYRQRYVDLIVTPEARDVFVNAFEDHPRHARVAGRAAFPRSRNADDALHPRRRHRAALRHASQRAGPRSVPARGAGVVSQAPHRGRVGAGLRDQPQLPQRRRVDPPQPRVHHARAVRGLRHVHRDHGPDRERDPRRGERGAGTTALTWEGARSTSVHRSVAGVWTKPCVTTTRRSASPIAATAPRSPRTARAWACM
jgi:hypothetical protein